MKKSKVLIYGGTTEGRKLTEYLLNKQVRVHVCVATAYGESLLPKEESLTVSCKRMDAQEMKAFMEDYHPEYVIDATHPYAKEVTQNIRTACGECECSYLRLIRNPSEEEAGFTYVENVEEAVRFLETTEGNILLTTGSKELEAYTKLPEYRKRIYARVLSVKEVVEKCVQLGLEGRHLICMQGPFSEEMNLAMLREYQITWLVTKESGAAGGYREKCMAAERAGAKVLVIGRPEKEKGYTYQVMCDFLKEKLELKSNGQTGRVQVSLVGIGMGTEDTFTIEGKKACRSADLLIGAKRMLSAAAKEGQAVYMAYKPQEILEYIKSHPEYEKIAVVLSGDVGFFSGAKRLLALLEKEPQIETKVIPGLSSAAYFCAKLGISWEDAALISAHGRESNLITTIRDHKKTIALASDAGGIRSMIRKMTEFGYGSLYMAIGTDLSYDTEEIRQGKAEEFLDYNGDNLAVLYVENPDGGMNSVTQGLSDEEFIRGDVPMTKSEVRSVSLSRLRIKKNSIIYDVGAGTGSVAVEAALLAVDGHVYAVERKAEAIFLIRENQKKMKTDNLTIIEGEAPDALKTLPEPDCVFIGGSGGNLKDIVKQIAEKNPKVRIVINAIALETLAETMKVIKELKIKDEEIIQLTAARSRNIGGYHMMTGQNPVYVICFTLDV